MKVDAISVAVYTVPTDTPESDGTLTWSQTTMVLVEARAGGVSGLGYTYADLGVALLIRDTLARVVTGLDPMNIPSHGKGWYVKSEISAGLALAAWQSPRWTMRFGI